MKKISFLLLFLFPALANANVVVDAVSSGTIADTASSITISHTVGTLPNRYLVVMVAWDPSDSVTLNSVTYNGTSLNSEGTVSANNQGFRKAAYYDLVNPVSGTYNIVVTFSNDAYIAVADISMSGVNQGTPFSHLTTNFGSSVSPTLTITSAPGDLVLSTDVLNHGTGLTVDSGVNVILSGNLGAALLGYGIGYEQGTASVTRTDSSGNIAWGMIGASVNAAYILTKDSIYQGKLYQMKENN